MRGFFLVFLSFITTFANAQGDFEFVPNQGQFHKNVLYRADVPSGTLFLEQDGMTFSFFDGEIFHEMHHGEKVDKVHFHAYKIKFKGANLKSSTKLNHLNKGVLSYYLGKDSSKWATGLKGGGEVYYKDLYEGIDFKIYTKNGSLKYDFIVHPGADPNEIKMTYDGLDGLSKRGNDLFLFTSLGTITDSEPVAFQNQEIVDVSFNLKGNTVGFDIGKYSSNEDLIIDPTLVFSTYSGSVADNFGYTATFDDDGNLYAGGSVFNQGYPTTTGAFDVSFNSIDTLQSANGVKWGVSDIGITKYSSDGSSRIYSTYIGGDLCEVPHSLIVNDRDELFIFGTTGSSDYPTSENAFNRNFSGGSTTGLLSGIFINYINGSDIVLSRLSADGSSMLASTYVGGSFNDGLNGNISANYADEFRGEIILDEFQNVVVGTSTFSSDFPVTANAHKTSIGGLQDGVVFKLDESLSSMIWSSYFGGQNNDAIYSLIKSNSNDFYVAGGTMSMDLNFPIESFQSNYQGGSTDGFYAKFSSNGNSVTKGSYFGSDSYDQVFFIREDRQNQVYLFGQSTKYGDYWIKNAGFNSPNSGQFISKLSENQNELEWSTTFGSGNNRLNISPTAFMVDLCNKVYLSGWGDIDGGIFYGTRNMPLTNDAYDSTSLGRDFYLMVMESDASSLIYGSYFGGDQSGEHVDGGTSRFDRKGIMYQSVCAGCGGYDDFPTEPDSIVVSNTNNGLRTENLTPTGCNNGVFKFDFGLPNIVADFDIPKFSCLSYPVLPFNDSKILNATSFLWDFGDGTFSTDTNPSHFYSIPDTYKIVLKVFDSTACNFSDSLTKNIIIMGSEYKNSLDTFSCFSFSSEIGISPYPDNSVNYSWFPSFGLSDSSIANPIATLDENQQYQLIVSGNTCADTIYQNIIISKFDLKIFGDTLICNSTPEIRLYNETESNLIHHWSSSSEFSDTLIYGFEQDEFLLQSDLGQNSIYVKLVDSMGCDLVDSVLIEVYEYEVSYDSNLSICLNDSITIFPFGYEGYDSVSFNWGPSPLLVTSRIDTNAVLIGAFPGVYSIPVISASANSCSDTDYVTISVNSFEGGLEVYGDTILCNSFPEVTLYNESEINLNHHWSNNIEFSDTLLFGLDERQFLLEPSLGENKVFVKVEDSLGCDAIDSVFIGVYQYDINIESNVNVCLGDSIEVFPVGYESYDSVNFNWGPSPLLTSSVNDTNAVIHGVNLGDYFVPVTSTSAYGCSDTDSIYVTIKYSDTKVKAFGDTIICNSFPLITLNNETDTNLIHHWSSDNNYTDTLLYGLNESQISLQTSLGENYVFVKVIDSVSCFAIDSVFLGVYDYNISYHENLEICLNDSIKMFPVGYENYDLVNFNWGPSPLLTSQVDDTIAVFEGIAPGLYSIPVTSTSAYSCSDTDYVNIRVSNFDTTANISLTTNFDTLINNEQAILTVMPEGYNYIWSPVNFVDKEYENNAEVVINQSTLFTVQINDPLVDKCFRTDSVFIVFIDSKCEDPYVYVPNAFSPNGDGENDVLYVRGRNITDLYFAIFNRWGEKVFETEDQSIGWDGYFRNRNSDPAVFDYYLKYFCDGSKQYFQKGNVTLIR